MHNKHIEFILPINITLLTFAPVFLLFLNIIDSQMCQIYMGISVVFSLVYSSYFLFKFLQMNKCFSVCQDDKNSISHESMSCQNNSFLSDNLFSYQSEKEYLKLKE